MFITNNLILKNKKNSEDTSLSIPVNIIYDSFAIQFLVPYVKNGYDNVIIRSRISYIKKALVKIILKLMKQQVLKYLSRKDRYIEKYKEEILQMINNNLASNYIEIFGKMTLRSANHRSHYPEDQYNDKWKQIAVITNDLANCSSSSEAIDIITRQNGLLNLVHNTETLFLDKFTNGNDLIQALNRCNNAQTVNGLYLYVSDDIKELIRDNRINFYN